MSLLSQLADRFASKPRITVVNKVHSTWNGMTLDQWKRSPDHIKFAVELWSNPLFRDLLAVLNNTLPVTDLNVLDATGAAIQLGRKQGYQECLAVLTSLPAWPAQPSTEVEADYSTDEQNSEE